MKQRREKKPDQPRGRELPSEEEIKAIFGEAQFGEDAENPMLWQLWDLKTQVAVRASPEGPSIIALTNRFREHIGKAGPMWRSEAFIADLEQAVLTRDAEFFREVARLLETRVAGPQRRIDLEVTSAFIVLRADAEHEGREWPTKKEVREGALFSIALADFERRQNPPLSEDQMYDCDEEGVPQLKPEIARAVQREMEQFPEQNWTRVFKRCGLDHLAEDKGGRRPKPASKRKTIDR